MKIPVLLVTGFLGSGKTTFINWVLSQLPNTKISLILNEFGDIKLESQFITQHSEDVIELANGCMCCVAKSDIPRVVNYILDTSAETQLLIIEASGLSDPDPVRNALREGDLAQRIRLDTVVCIIDTPNFMSAKDDHPLIMSQAGDADIIVMNKTQLTDKETRNNVRELLNSVFDHTLIVEFDDNLNVGIFTQPHTFVQKSSQNNGSQHHHEHDHYHEFWYINPHAFDLDKLSSVFNSLPASIIRAKGIVMVRSKSYKQEKYLLQGVSGRYELIPSEWKEDETKQNQILFIGRDIDQKSISDRLDEAIIVG